MAGMQSADQIYRLSLFQISYVLVLQEWTAITYICKLLPINSPISRQTSPIDTIELLKENKQKQDSM